MTPWIVAHWAPPSVRFSRQEHLRVGCHFPLRRLPSPRDWSRVSCSAGTLPWATREVLVDLVIVTPLRQGLLSSLMDELSDFPGSKKLSRIQTWAFRSHSRGTDVRVKRILACQAVRSTHFTSRDAETGSRGRWSLDLQEDNWTLRNICKFVVLFNLWTKYLHTVSTSRKWRCGIYG